MADVGSPCFFLLFLAISVHLSFAIVVTLKQELSELPQMVKKLITHPKGKEQLGE